MVEMFANVLLFMTLEYNPENKVMFPYSDTVYRENRYSNARRDEKGMHSKYHIIVEGKYYKDLEEHNIYWFLNNNNEYEIYLFKNDELNLLFTIKTQKAIKISKTCFVDRTEIRVYIEGNKTKSFTYYPKINSVIIWDESIH